MLEELTAAEAALKTYASAPATDLPAEHMVGAMLAGLPTPSAAPQR